MTAVRELRGVPAQRDRRPWELGDDEPRVGVTGLPALYQHGLSAGLSRAGLVAVTLDRDEEVAAFAAAPGPRALVLPAERQAEVLARLGDLVDQPGLAVVLVLSDRSPASHLEALRTRATGVVPADAELSHAVVAVRAALAGHVVLPAALAHDLSRAERTGGDAAPDLAPDEAAWLRALAEGGTVVSLARRTGYSEREMYRQLAAIYSRLGAATRTEALLRAERWGLLDPGPAPG